MEEDESPPLGDPTGGLGGVTPLHCSWQESLVHSEVGSFVAGKREREKNMVNLSCRSPSHSNNNNMVNFTDQAYIVPSTAGVLNLFCLMHPKI